MRKKNNSVDETKATAQRKLGFGKAILILIAICSLYAALIPKLVLTQYPIFLPFVDTMESIFPAIKGFARLSPIPEVVRFYYATMWIAFPLLYWYLRIFRIHSFYSTGYEYPFFKALLGLFFFSTALLICVYFMAFHEIKATAALKSALVSGRGNLLATGLTLNSFSIGITSALIWLTIFLTLDFTFYAFKRILNLCK